MTSFLDFGNFDFSPEEGMPMLEHSTNDDDREPGNNPVQMKMRIISLYIEENYQELSNHLNEIQGQTEVDGNRTDDELKKDLLAFLFSDVLEREVFDFLNEKDIIDFKIDNELLLEKSLNLKSFTNLNYILFGISNTRLQGNFTGKKGLIEKYFSKILGFKICIGTEFSKIIEVQNDKISEHSRVNILKYLILIKGPKKEANDIKEMGDFFKLYFSLHENNEDNFLKLLRPYLKNSGDELRKLDSTADMNILIPMILHNGWLKALRDILKCFFVDINMLMRVHKNQQPYRLVCYLAEKGYHDLIKTAVSRKDLEVCIKENHDKFSSVFSACVVGQSYYKGVNKHNREFSVNYETCIGLIIAHDDFKMVLKSQNPMSDVMRYNFNNAAIKLTEKFGLKCEFIDEINDKILRRFLNSRVKTVKGDCIEVDFKFLAEDDENKALVKLKDSELNASIKHPVLATYIELKNSRFKTSQRWNFLAFLLFFIVTCFTGFLFKSYYFHKIWSILCFGIACLFLTLREGFQIYFIYEDVKRDNRVCDGFKSDYGLSSTLKLAQKTFEIYIYSLSNIAEIFLILSTELAILSLLLDSTYLFKFSFSITILLGALELSFLLTAAFSSSFGIYFFMLKTVAITFGRIFIFFLIIILAFSFAFHVVFFNDLELKNNSANNSGVDYMFNDFIHPWTAIVKTTTMLTGEYDASSLKFNGMWSITILMLFILTAIVLFNLINGLAITDVQELREDAELLRLINKIDALNNFENLLDCFFVKEKSEKKINFIKKIVILVLKKTIREPYDTSSTVKFSKAKRRASNGEDCIGIKESRFADLQRIFKMNAVKSLRQIGEIKLNYISAKVGDLESNISHIDKKLEDISKILKTLENK